MTWIRRMLVCWALTILAAPSGANAQGDGLQVDPDSPSGTEYQLPLERARERARQGGPSDAVRPGERSAPAFGQGSRRGGAGGEGSGEDATGAGQDGVASGQDRSGQDGGGDSGRKGTGSGKQSSGSGTGGPGGASGVTATPTGSSGKSDDSLGVGAIAVGVLLLGGLIGLGIRRRLR